MRSLGVALVLPFAIHLWRQPAALLSRGMDLLLLLPLSCWGLLTYMGFQASQFDRALAFVQAQDNWTLRKPESTSKRILALATVEPAWSLFGPLGDRYWGPRDRAQTPLFEMRFMNPIFFLLIAGFIVFGVWRRWLNANEAALALGLLGIPYFTRSYEMCMAGFGRFGSVVCPAYLVMGRVLSILPLSVAAALLAVSGLLLGLFAALFAGWYPVV